MREIVKLSSPFVERWIQSLTKPPGTICWQKKRAACLALPTNHELSINCSPPYLSWPGITDWVRSEALGGGLVVPCHAFVPRERWGPLVLESWKMTLDDKKTVILSFVYKWLLWVSISALVVFRYIGTELQF